MCMGSYYIGDKLSSNEKPVALSQVDISDVERLTRMLGDAARAKAKDDGLPRIPNATHARIVFELVRGASIPDASTVAGVTRRTGERLQASDAARSVMQDYAAVRLKRAIDAGTALAREGLGDAYATLVEAAASGNTTAAKEVMKLAGVQVIAEHREANTTSIELPSHIEQDYTDTKEAIREEITPPTPPPLFLSAIRPQWTATLGQAEVDRSVEDEKE
jgi:hypothetical protein